MMMIIIIIMMMIIIIEIMLIIIIIIIIMVIIILIMIIIIPSRILGLRRLVYTNCSAPWEVNFYDNLATDYLNVAVLVVFFFVTGIEIRSTGEEVGGRRPGGRRLVCPVDVSTVVVINRGCNCHFYYLNCKLLPSGCERPTVGRG